MKSAHKILLIEDDQDLARLLPLSLFESDVRFIGSDFEVLMNPDWWEQMQGQFDIVISDHLLSGYDNFEAEGYVDGLGILATGHDVLGDEVAWVIYTAAPQMITVKPSWMTAVIDKASASGLQRLRMITGVL